MNFSITEGRNHERAQQDRLCGGRTAAVHPTLDPEPKILDDSIVLRLLDDNARQKIREYAHLIYEPRAARPRAHVVLRSRYAEDRLDEALRRGTRQYVILGAGFDTFAYRQPNWARSLKIFEVDQLASQQWKRKRLAEAGLALPDNLEFVAIDFEKTSLLFPFRIPLCQKTRPSVASKWPARSNPSASLGRHTSKRRL